MKTLYLLRHAKSNWDQSVIEDHDRPLSPRGSENATQMGQHMRAMGYLPGEVLCSTSRRTSETLERLKPYLPRDTGIRFAREIYLAPPEHMLSLLRDTADKVLSVLIIAHSPGTEGLALTLAGAPETKTEAALRAQIEEKFPTAALAVLALPDAPWRSLAPGSGRLDAFVRPKDL